MQSKNEIMTSSSDHSKFIIGIDLGTTNSSVTYIDTDITKNPNLTIQIFRIPQISSEGILDTYVTLPSFCYLPSTEEEQLLCQQSLKWIKNKDYIVGHYAQTLGAKVPTRLIQSAKSWLCNPASNRKDKILPIEAADIKRKLSPVETTTYFLNHIRESWNNLIAKGDISSEFEQQEIILTVPASFDEVARALTVEAAKNAGYAKMTLLEEPQAAFYSWISYHEKEWQKQFKEGDTILVCDVGGGTTDFSLIEVKNNHGVLGFQRMAVGDHLLLGGDNMDAAIAHYIEGKIHAKNNNELTTAQWLQLKQQARLAKEKLLTNTKNKVTGGKVTDNKIADDKVVDDLQSKYSVIIQGQGSSVIQGSISIDVTHSEIKDLLLSGFFTQDTWENALQMRKTSGFRTMGLPYEDEPSITKHLATFLNKNSISHLSQKPPNFLLFNGGAFKPQFFQNAIVEAISVWFPQNKLQILESQNLDIAVARGAAYYGKVRRGFGTRIGGGSPCSYYLKLDIKDDNNITIQKAVTLLPRGSEEGYHFEMDQNFKLTPNIPVSFSLYSSHTRLQDKEGDLIDINAEDLHALPPIYTVCHYGKKQSQAAVAATQPDKIPVTLGIKLTEIGTMEIWLHAPKTNHKWLLEFQLRTATGQDNTFEEKTKKQIDETFDSAYIKEAEKALLSVFSTKALSPGKIIDKLEEIIQKQKKDWSPSLLRGLWTTLLQCASQRKISSDFETRWWNLTGFFLRPGYGYPLDDHRIKELWKIILESSPTLTKPEIQLQAWICFRRISGGLNKGQQTQIANLIYPHFINKKTGKIEIKNNRDLNAFTEQARALASLELLDITFKAKLGNLFLERILNGSGTECDYWALSRIGGRHLLYGSITNVIPRDTCVEWIEKLLTIPPNFSNSPSPNSPSPNSPNSPSPNSPYNKEQLGSQLRLEYLLRLGTLLSHLARKTNQREYNIPETIIKKILDYLKDHPHLEQVKNVINQDTSLTQSEKDYLFGDNLPSGLSVE